MHPLTAAMEELDALAVSLDRCAQDVPPVTSFTDRSIAAWSTRREEALASARAAEQRILQHIHAAAAAYGVEPTLAGIATVEPDGADAVRERLEDVHAARARLQQRDRESQTLLSRATAVVRAYLNTLAPPAQAYGRFGGLQTQAPPSSRRTRA